MREKCDDDRFSWADWLINSDSHQRRKNIPFFFSLFGGRLAFEVARPLYHLFLLRLLLFSLSPSLARSLLPLTDRHPLFLDAHCRNTTTIRIMRARREKKNTFWSRPEQKQIWPAADERKRDPALITFLKTLFLFFFLCRSAMTLLEHLMWGNKKHFDDNEK